MLRPEPARPWRWALLLLPFVAVGLLSGWLVPTVGDRIARAFGHASALRVAPTPPGPASAPDGLPTATAQPATATSGPGTGAPVSARRVRPRLGDGAAARSLAVDASQAARALAHGLRGVHGTNVVDAAGRPGGVRLSGVDAIDVGLADGDVVVSVDGAQTPDVDSATAAVTHALATNERIVRAIVVRDGESMSVTVEVPDAGAP